MVDLKNIKDFCNNRKIIIVGNSSRILQGSYGTLVDNYEIVVRINRGYQPNDLYRNFLGSKTTILSLGVKSQTFATRIVLGNNVTYILCPIIYSDRLSYINTHHVEKEEYQLLKQELGGTKPSTGIATFNFFNQLNNFERLDLIGFDFFESSGPHRNQLGHLRVPDHHGIKEKEFFERVRDPQRSLLHKMPAGGPPHNNIPRIGNQIRYKTRRK